MKSQTGGCMSMGWGTIHAKSSKQKKSSTEAELVEMSEYVPYNLWLSFFMKEQGYPLQHNTTQYTKITKVQSKWRRTVEIHAQEIPDILTLVISLSRIM